MAGGFVLAVHRSSSHSFSKFTEDRITLLAGLGVAGDAHAGTTVKHRSRLARDAGQPNLRQVHLLHAELFEELMQGDHPVWPGELGENITTRALDLLSLPTGARLRLGGEAVVELTGLRNPCSQLDRFQSGLTAAVLARGPHGEWVRKAGVMAVVITGGVVRGGDGIGVVHPAPPHRPLQPV